MEKIEVRSLSSLYNSGFIDNVKTYYIMTKDILKESYPFITKYDDEVMAIYISYYLEAYGELSDVYKDLQRILSKDELSEEEKFKVSDYMSEIVMEWFESLYELDEGSDKKSISEHRSYVISYYNEFSNNKLTDKFMKVNYNSIFENAVRSYFLCNKLDIEKINLDIEGDNLYKNTLYCLYTLFSKMYQTEFAKNRSHLKKFFKSIDYDKAVEITNHLLRQLDDALFSVEEYLQMRYLRVNRATQVKLISEAEIKRLSGFGRKIGPKKNNE